MAKNVLIGFAVSSHDSSSLATATFDHVTVRDIRFPNAGQVFGVGISGFDFDPTDAAAVTLTVLNSTIANTGVQGVAFNNAAGQVAGTTIQGRGADAFVNAQNGVQVVGKSTVTITGSTISGFSAAGASSGVAVSQTADGAPTVTLIGNTLTGNNIGLTVGVTAGDASVVTAQYNNIAGNLTGVDSDHAAAGVSAPNNWWGDASGPYNALNNPGGLGNPVDDNTTFAPVLTTPTPVVTAATPAAYLAAVSTIGVAISPAPGQPNPDLTNPVEFQVVFAQPVTGFDASDVVVVSSPAGSTPVLAVSGTGTTYTVSVTGLVGQGLISIQIPANPANGIVTADGHRNVGFYRRNGFALHGTTLYGTRRVVFLGRDLQPPLA
jgi:hypothetical protein